MKIFSKIRSLFGKQEEGVVIVEREDFARRMKEKLVQRQHQTFESH